MTEGLVSVRYMVEDVDASIGSTPAISALSCTRTRHRRSPRSCVAGCGCYSRAEELGRATDARRMHPQPGGWNGGRRTGRSVAVRLGYSVVGTRVPSARTRLRCGSDALGPVALIECIVPLVDTELVLTRR
jgi:hypothetical protein